MNCETLRVPGLPGAADVTDGSVDYYDMDWPIVENNATEEQMQKCASAPCAAANACAGNSPEQTDTEEYEIVSE